MKKLRAGFQLVELTVTLAIAVILVAGSSVAIFIAGEATGVAMEYSGQSNEKSHAVNLIRRDLLLAQHVGVQNNGVVIHTTTVDGQLGTVQYTWGGESVDEVQRSSGGRVETIRGSAKVNAIEWMPSTPQHTATETEIVDRVSLASATQQAKLAVRSISAKIPETYAEEGFLVAAVAVYGDVSGSITTPAGWERIAIRSGGSFLTGRMTLALYSSQNLGVADECELSWSGYSNASICVAHFYSPENLQLIGGSTATGFSTACTTPSITVPSDLGLVIRACAAISEPYGKNATCLAGSHSVAMESTGLGTTVGLCYHNRPGELPADAFSFPLITTYASASASFGP